MDSLKRSPRRKRGPRCHTESRGAINKRELVDEVKTHLVCVNVLLLLHDLLSKAYSSPHNEASFSGKIRPSAHFPEILGFPWDCRSPYSHQRVGQLCGKS